MGRLAPIWIARTCAVDRNGYKNAIDCNSTPNRLTYIPMVTLTIQLTDAAATKLSAMADRRGNVRLEDMAAYVVEAECTDEPVRFPSHVPGAKRSAGRK